MKIIIICFVGDRGEVLLQKKLTGLPLKEDFIIKKSIEFFNDPEPCMIHRSAVMKRVYMEMEEFFRQAMEEGKQEVAWEDLPCFIKEALNIQQKIQSVSFE